MAANSVSDQLVDPNWSIYAAPINTLLQVAEQLGVDRNTLLLACGLDESELKIPERRFPVNSYFRLFQLAADTTNDPDFGLRVGRVTYLKGLNLQLYLSTVCECFRDYLNLIPSSLRLRGDIGQMAAYRTDDQVELRWEPLLPEIGRKRLICDEMLSASVGIFNSLCVMPVAVTKVSFTYSRPQDITKLEETFGRNLSFEQPYSSLFFSRQALDFPILKQDYQDGPDQKHRFRELFEDNDPSDQLLATLKQSIVQYLPEGGVTIDKLASKLNISRRTLQRRLADRNTNFLHILQEVRSKVALRYLSDERLGITEIAFLLGYADQGSFSSAFKSWHGVSPRDYRRK
ncbi:MAG: AraC family transcriptional regulator [Porticoccaceae bacterium]|jgi:AraC-like DNA-binding protein|nr:AraC family transcriptional regulator [Porticoccaceae bacterium]MBT5577631.1 AraC family transcriptional regulator [Porticoccaceae bacterium]MBT7375118.1 AraC family transcriptional regulator [Porticoccaceae bacterium]